jgi:hypothetical protein
MVMLAVRLHFPRWTTECGSCETRFTNSKNFKSYRNHTFVKNKSTVLVILMFFQ